MAKNFFKRGKVDPIKPRAVFVASLIVDGTNAQLVPLYGEIAMSDLLNALTQLRDSVIRQASEHDKSALPAVKP